MLYTMSKNKKFDYKWNNLVLSLADEIKFTKDMNIALINFQLHNAIIFSLPIPPLSDILLSLESKALMHITSDFPLPLSPSENTLLLLELKTSILVTKVVFFPAAANSLIHQKYQDISEIKNFRGAFSAWKAI